MLITRLFRPFFQLYGSLHGWKSPAHLSRAEQRKWVQDQRRSWDEEQAERRKCGSELLDRLRKLDSKLCRPGESVEKEKQKRVCRVL